MRALFFGSPLAHGRSASAPEERRVALFRRVLGHLNAGVLTGRKASDCVDLLLIEADQMPGRCFPELINQALVALASRGGSSGASGAGTRAGGTGSRPPHAAARTRLGLPAQHGEADSAKAAVLAVVPKFMSRIEDAGTLTLRDGSTMTGAA